MTCRECGAENRPGRKFCGECGSPLVVSCTADGGADRIVRAEALAQLGGELMRSDEPEGAGALFDEALTVLEREQAWPELASALVNRAAYLTYDNRLEESTGILRQALVLAEEHDLPTVALRVRFNLAGSR